MDFFEVFLGTYRTAAAKAHVTEVRPKQTLALIGYTVVCVTVCGRVEEEEEEEESLQCKCWSDTICNSLGVALITPLVVGDCAPILMDRIHVVSSGGK